MTNWKNINMGLCKLQKNIKKHMQLFSICFFFQKQ